MPDSLTVDWAFGDDLPDHCDFQLNWRVRRRSGADTVFRVANWHFCGAGDTLLTIDKDTTIRIPVFSDMDAVGVVLHNGDSVGVNTAYFTPGTYGSPDQNMYAQVWFAIPGPSGLSAVEDSSRWVSVSWSNNFSPGSHYTTQIWRDGQLDTVVAGTVTSVDRYVPGSSSSAIYKVRLLADRVVGPGMGTLYSTLNQPASAFSNSDTVTVNVLPVIVRLWGCEGTLDCEFYQASYDPDGYIVEWKWTFGDGTVVVDSTGATCTYHSYESSGGYGITFKVTDNSGASKTTLGLAKPGVPDDPFTLC